MSYADIPGFMAPEVEDFYCAMAERLTPESRVVEVGVAYGRSIAFLVEACLAKAQKLGEHVRLPTFFAVDTWADFMGCERDDWIGQRARELKSVYDSPYAATVAMLGSFSPVTLEVVHPLRMKSTAAAMRLVGPIDLVFIDANHTYEDVRDDIVVWEPLVRRGGILAGDDYDAEHFPGVVRAVDQFARARSQKFTTRGRVWITEV